MRTLFYIILFITPTALVLIYRQNIQDYLVNNGLLGPKPKTTQSAPPKLPLSPEDSDTPNLTAATPEKATSTPPRPSAADIDRQVAQKCPMPTFKSLEVYLGNWREVPKRAFPEVVTLRKPVDLELLINGKVGGKSTLRVGQQAYPISFDGKTLSVSGRPNDETMKGAIPVDDTDFKDQIRKTYDSWKTKHQGRVIKLRKEEKQRLLAAANAEEQPSNEAPATEVASLGKEPSVDPDGTVPVMVASIRSGQVTEIKLDQIQYWRWNGYEEIGGQGYWTGAVGYTASTIFGEINAEGKALIRNGKVLKWIYSGSEEEIR